MKPVESIYPKAIEDDYKFLVDAGINITKETLFKKMYDAGEVDIHGQRIKQKYDDSYLGLLIQAQENLSKRL
jgi:hypothetical protein